MSHRKSDLGIPYPRKAAKVVLVPRIFVFAIPHAVLAAGIFIVNFAELIPAWPPRTLRPCPISRFLLRRAVQNRRANQALQCWLDQRTAPLSWDRPDRR